ncbi:MAG TPA: radical SAM protein [Planctomycetota bacterium]|nr:radical SAM protein [Planctomycetota bacterium]
MPTENGSFPLPTPEIHVWVAYLTARCNFACDYCIQKPAMIPGRPRKPWGRYQELSGRQWVDALNALPVRPVHPLILTGGEPSLHHDFAFIASHLEGYDLDMTSNLTFDVAALAQAMRARGKTFKTSFHTYHPKFLAPEQWLLQAERLRDSGIVEQPTFSMVNLQRFPHFRDDEHDANLRQLVELADHRGLLYQFNEFRGTHMGAPFDRGHKQALECTSAWVNIDPEGNVFNCQYHLTERTHSFGNITQIDRMARLPQMGEFFACSDFGFCDPCHENSGHGAFRDAQGQVFRRTSNDTRVYLKWMQPAAIKQVAARYLAQGDVAEAEFALLAAIGKQQDSGGGEDFETWADLGVTLYDAGKKKQSLAALLHAIAGGVTRTETVASALLVAREVGLSDHARLTILQRVPAQILDRIEQGLAAVQLQPPSPQQR